MRAIQKAAAYIPPGTVDGRRVAGPDEDGFTLGATAVERLLDASEGAPGIGRILLVGDLPPSAETDLARFLATSVLMERFRAGEEGLRSALRAALEAESASAPSLVVAVDFRGHSNPQSAPSPGRFGDAGVAVRIMEDSPPHPPDDLGPPSRDPGSATGLLFRLAKERRDRDPSTWVGDWDSTGEGAHRTAQTPPGHGGELASNSPVSQGAYVPKARYLENIPSRWWFAGERCAACGIVTFPARGRCRQCGAREGLVAVRLPRDGGQVIAATVIGPGGQPTEFDAQVEALGPYGVVLVELAPGVRVTLQSTDGLPAQMPIGSRVATRLRRLYPMEGEWRYGRKAVPL